METLLPSGANTGLELAAEAGPVSSASGGRSGAGLGGTSPAPLAGATRHAQPGSILYAYRVNKMSPARTRPTQGGRQHPIL
jgi:hypothetical protein